MNNILKGCILIEKKNTFVKNMALKIFMDRLTTYLISSPSSVTITSSNACDILLCTIFLRIFTHKFFLFFFFDEQIFQFIQRNNPFKFTWIFICATLFTIQFLFFHRFFIYFHCTFWCNFIFLKLKKKHGLQLYTDTTLFAAFRIISERANHWRETKQLRYTLTDRW